MTTFARRISKIPFAPVVAVAFGVACGLLVFAVPAWRFGQIIAETGLPTVISAARPPLGTTARALVALTIGIAVTVGLWGMLTLAARLLKLDRRRVPIANGRRIDTTSPLASAKRRPIFAQADLGAPFMSDEVLELQIPVPPIVDEAQVISPPASIAASPLALDEPTARREPPADESQASVSALLARLERAVEQLSTANPNQSITDVISVQMAASKFSTAPN